MLISQQTQLFSIILKPFRTREKFVSPLNSIVVIDTKTRWSKFNAVVSRLCNIIKTCIIHDGSRCTILLREGWRTQRVGWKCCGRCHVVHKSKRMTNLVGNNILECLLYNTVRHLRCTCTRVNLCRLNKSPVVNRVYNIIINKNGSIDYLSCARVCPRRSHSILNVSR